VAADVLIEAVVVLTVSFLEEYLNSLVGLAAFHQQDALKRFLETNGTTKRSKQSGLVTLFQ
jgi:hypothetical protein